MRVYSPNREERAFLYQEARDLDDLMKDLGSLSVMVEESKVRRGRPVPSRFRVTFVLAPESVGMTVQADGRNIYDATIAAKEEAQRQLNAIVNSLPRNFKAGSGIEAPKLGEFLH
jgi:ribosome-associated translation inhibitor RaiA